MTLRKLLIILCMIISILCLAAGYGISGHWVGALMAVLIAPAWLFARKYADSRLLHLCLFISVGLAVTGCLIGSPALMMIFSSVFALAVWDLLLLDSALRNTSALTQTRRYETKHIQSLVLALGFGLLATVLGSSLKIQPPFVILVLFISFILFALDRIWDLLRKTGKR